LKRWAFRAPANMKASCGLEYYFDHYDARRSFVRRFVAVGRAFVPFTAGLVRNRLRNFARSQFSAIGLGLGHRRPRLHLGSNWRLVEKYLKSLSAGIVVLAL